jgi:putative hydrolase of the HAD superfamily
MSEGCPLRAVLVDLGYTLARWDVPDALLRTSYREAQAALAVARPDQAPPDDLLLRVTQHVGAALRASHERGDLAEQDHYALFAEALAHHGYALAPGAVRQIADLEHAAFVRHLRVPDATLRALGALRARGLRLGLVSNVSVPGALMRRTLAALGVAPYLDAAVFSSEVGVRKPHPRIYQAALAALSVAPAEALFVGDRVREDLVGPRALGMRVVLTHEYRQESPNGTSPEAVVQRFSDLPALVDRLMRDGGGA